MALNLENICLYRVKYNLNIYCEHSPPLQAFREDLVATQADLEDLQLTGDQLMTLVGEPERPEVRKNLEDTEATLTELNDKVEKRSKDLETALAKAVTFQDGMNKMMVWMQAQEEALG